MVCAGCTSGPWDHSEVKRIIAVWCRAMRVIERWIWVTLVSPSVIILSLKFHLKPKHGPETIQTLIHVQVNTLLIMVYAHCTDSTSHRQAVNATSCPAAAAIVVLLYRLILHLWSLKAYGVCEGRDWHPYYWVKAANEEYFLPIFNILKSEHSYAKVSYYFLFLTTQSFLAGQKKPLKLHLYH